MEEESMEFLWEGLLSITWQQLLMYVVGGLLIWLAIEKGFEPALLLPMGFGAILVNLPLSGVINQFSEGVGGSLRLASRPARPSPSCSSSASAL